jgi:hypothetical protein
MSDGTLLCLSQCGDTYEPAPGNRVYSFASHDQGETWEKPKQVYPETGESVYLTEMYVLDGTVHAFLQVHNGRFLNMRCVHMESKDNGKTWLDVGAPPFFPSFCFIRGMLPLGSGDIMLAYQHFPISEEENTRLVVSNHNISDCRQQRAVWDARIDHIENGVLVSADRGKSWQRFRGPDIPIKGNTGRNWAWTEPTLAELPDGVLVMLLRVCGSGVLWRSESKDRGRTWTAASRTTIPNPNNKPKLIPMDGGRIALIHTPNPKIGFENRNPLSIWISDDDLKTFKQKEVVTEFPGCYCYPDGFYENGHLLFTIEINRHEILFIDCDVRTK